MAERRWSKDNSGQYEVTFFREPPEIVASDGTVLKLRPRRMTVRYPSDDLADQREAARMEQAVRLMQGPSTKTPEGSDSPKGRFEQAFAVLEAHKPPGVLGRPTTTQTHRYFSRLRRITEEERLCADGERQRRPFEVRRHARERKHFDPTVTRVRAAVARRVGVSVKTVSNLWNDAVSAGWLLPLRRWKLRRVAVVYSSAGWRSAPTRSYLFRPNGHPRPKKELREFIRRRVLPIDLDQKKLSRLKRAELVTVLCNLMATEDRRWVGHTDEEGLREVAKLAFVRDGRPGRRADEWVELAREAGYLPPSK